MMKYFPTFSPCIFGIFLVFTLIGGIPHALADPTLDGFASSPPFQEQSNEYISKEYGIRFLYPARFIQEHSPHPEVIVLLTNQGKFPTINVLAQPGQYRVPGTETHAEMIAQSYRLIGLTNAMARISHLNLTNPAAFSQPLVEVQYTNDGIPFTATVAYIQKPDSYLIITYLESRDDSSAEARTHFFQSISGEAIQNVMSKDIPTVPTTSRLRPVLTLVGLIVVGTIIWLRRRKRLSLRGTK